MKHLSFFLLALAAAAPAPGQLATPNPAGLTWGHIHLNVADVELHKRIWVEYFGGAPVEKGPPTAVRLPNMLVALSEGAPTMGSRETVVNHFGFKVRDIERFLEKWSATGYEVGRVFTGAEGQANAYVALPDGIYVELQEDKSLHVEVMAHHVHFITPGHEDLLKWYTEVFGLEIRPRGSIATTTNAPGMNLSFSGADEKRAATKGAAIDHIGFEFENLEAFCRELEAKGIEFDAPYRDMPDIALKTAFITDPAGVRIELTEGYDRY